MPVNPATGEAEIGGSQFEVSLGNKVSEILSQRTSMLMCVYNTSYLGRRVLVQWRHLKIILVITSATRGCKTWRQRVTEEAESSKSCLQLSWGRC
jgi:hypothetical protein